MKVVYSVYVKQLMFNCFNKRFVSFVYIQFSLRVFQAVRSTASSFSFQ
jgi:hypothetical protein